MKNKINPSYETNSYVFVNDEIKLNIGFDNKDLVWESLNEEVATVNNGVVKGNKEGTVDIKVSLDNEELFVFKVTVVDTNEEIVKDLLKAHNSNIYHNNDLWVNGKHGYQADIYESVSKILFNDPLVINDTYLELGNKKWEEQSNEFMKSIEFITVHYTANIRDGANANAHGKYFVNPDQPTSIHYNTGNDGVFLCLDNNKRAAHAGDSSGPIFSWLDTGVEYDGCDIDKVKVTVSNDFYYVINGKKSLIKLPETYEYKERNTKHDYLENGLIKLQGREEFKKPEDFFNKMGFAFIVKDNKYHMSQTWWCYTQTLDGAICNVGGNRNSIGIESCVNQGSDLWYTWQKTAQLVAKLMVDNNLDINRVKGHHFYTAKNCPQPMMENNMELWYKFIELVEYEYLFLTKYKNYNIFLEEKSNIVDNKGRVLNKNSDIIEYTLSICNKEINFNKKLKLFSMVK